MRLVSYGKPGAWTSGIELEGSVVDTAEVARLAGWNAEGVAAARTNRTLLKLGLDAVHQLHGVARNKSGHLKSMARASLRLGPPIPDPQKIVCIGLNYHDHAKEVGATPPTAPIFFAKYPNSLVGEKDEVVPPRDTSKVDYEAELAVIIGRRGRYIEESSALDHVAGIMAFNDVSARDLQLANQLWTGGKAIDTFGPCGPALVTLDEIADIQNLAVRTRVDGDVLQDGNTSSMIFSVAQIIAFLSRIMTLEPGDIIATGTPAGVASAHKPARFLKSGNVVEVEIEGIGLLRNRIAEAV
ncbi:MAG: fumarylacetoacetate hydrolase family protein [Aestuariivirga sp.]|uniref:fumarylacetoacetate hydrolase family protein n=1 Tax=Aestuariivirga sp. TaxID=2650926 RepID=UPI0025C3CE24|nr:fumarylacetoacetate hydrolase family protein [Aestuariivirga sp.]MCA3561609.1 fumarylacetoacetate hydrolase family protein [Aestuariivirga sp.]